MGVTRHLDGEGPLASVGDPGTALSGAFDQDAPASRWTLGIALCLDQATDPAVLTGTIRGTRTIGDGFVFLGAYIRQFVPAQGDTPIGGVEGFPPNVSEPLRDLKGYPVSNPCQKPGSVDRNVPYTELLIGWGRSSGKDGGGWLGLDVNYTVDGRQYILAIAYSILICGPAVPARYCAEPSKPSGAPTPTP